MRCNQRNYLVSVLAIHTWRRLSLATGATKYTRSRANARIRISSNFGEFGFNELLLIFATIVNLFNKYTEQKCNAKLMLSPHRLRNLRSTKNISEDTLKWDKVY